MAKQRRRTRPTPRWQTLVESPLQLARGRFVSLEREAEGLLSQLQAKGRANREALEGWWEKVTPAGFRRAREAVRDSRRRWSLVQSRVVAASGVATQAQVRELHRELGRLSKKIDSLLPKKTVTHT